MSETLSEYMAQKPYTNYKAKRMVIKKRKQYFFTIPPLTLGHNVGKKIIYTYTNKKDTYSLGKTVFISYPPHQMRNIVPFKT